MHIIKEDHGYRASGFFEFYWNRWGVDFDVIYTGNDEDKWPWMIHVHFLFLNLFLHFPFQYIPVSKKERWCREWQQWGFSSYDDAIYFHWNEIVKVWGLPWFSSVHQRHEVRRADGKWVPYVGCWEDKEPDGREEFYFPYQYKLKRGEVQNRTATVYVDRMAWRPKGFTWTGLFENVRQSISVAFDDEVGERTGSWKGGTVGCGYEMLPSETPEQTLRRMERERVFD